MRISRVDAALAVLLTTAVAALYFATFQERMFGDGPRFVNLLHGLLDRGPAHYHTFHLWLGERLGSLAPGSPAAGLEYASTLGGALAAGAVFLAVRGMGATRVASTAVSLLLALSPAAWFFSTTVEVHAPHLGAVALCLAVTVLAPWNRPRFALFLTAAAFSLVVLTHPTGVLLGPGWVVLVHAVRGRAGATFRWREALFVTGPVLLLALLATLSLRNLASGGGAWPFSQRYGAVIGEFREGGSVLSMFSDGQLRPLGLLWPLAALGAWRLRRQPLALAAAALLVLLPCAFFLWFRVAERGGYALDVAPFLALLAAACFPAGSAGPAPVHTTHSTTEGATAAGSAPRPLHSAVLAVLLLLPQAALAQRDRTAYDRTLSVPERVDEVREALPGGGVLLSLQGVAPLVQIYDPEVDEYPLSSLISPALAAEISPAEFLEFALPLMAELETLSPLALDRSYRHFFDRGYVQRARPYLEALEAALATQHDISLREDTDWSITRLTAVY